MRVTSTLFRSRDLGDAPVGDLTGPDRGEAGADGEAWFKELVGGGPDINHELSGAAKFDQYDEMRKTDAVVKSTLLLPKLTVRSAMWGLEPASADPVDLLIRDMVAENIGLDGHDGWIDLSWPKQLEQLMLMLDFGVSLEEIVWGDVRQWRDADGDEHLVRPIVRLAPRPPRTVHKIDWADGGTIRSLHQNVAGTKAIPGEKLCYSVYERDPGRWEGVSMLRAAWGPWRLKKLLIVVSGVAWDRWSLGVPAVWHPDTTDGESIAKQIGRNLRSHQRAYVHFPVPSGGTKEDSEWALEILNGAASIADPSTLLKWCDDQIATVGLQQFTRQGLGTTGARATSETQAEGFYLAVEALAEDIRFERSRQLIRRLVEVNFGRDAAERRLPRLTVSRIQSRNLTVVANAIGVLAGAGLTFTEAGDANNIRELLGLDPLPDDVSAALDSLPDDVGVKVNRPEGAGLGL